VPEAIARGSRILMHYRLHLADGTPVDASTPGEPLPFVLGDGSLDAGLEQFLLGMRAGERAVLLVRPGEAFGRRDPGNLHPIPRAEFPAGMALAEGTVVGFATPAGLEVPGTVVEPGPEAVLVDFNHPLAGRALRFEVEILAVEPGG
jgi:FKBP-type peptidyl-prolyl cis-trans isomerase SlpA